MQNVIIGTAGHVDHGKTCLIRALTGIDTDRLAEEKRRGVTIELGFASLPNDEDMRIGIIDVPGHEKFVKNMLAGIGGIDLVLLIIALDEGVMPQTREHFEILKMLHIRRGIIVFTKADLVDEETAQVVGEETAELVKGSFLEEAPVIRVSAVTGENIDALKKLILEQVRGGSRRRNAPELFRLPLDRVFSMKGFGTIVTGTLIEGSCRVGEEVMLYPQERTVRIRGIEHHNRAAEDGFAGQRTALNLTGIRKDEIERGEVLAAPHSMLVGSLTDVHVELFGDTKRILKNQDRVHVCYGASQVRARVVLLNKDRIAAGESAYAQFFFEKPAAVKFGDFFVIRFFSPIETFGGGRFLEAAAVKHKRGDEAILTGLRIKDAGSPAEILEEEILERGAAFPNLHELAVRTNNTEEETERLLAGLKKAGRVLLAGEDGFVHKTYWEQITAFSQELLAGFHQENSMLEGMERAVFLNRLGHRFHVPQKTGEDLLAELEKRGVIRSTERTAALASFSSAYSGEQGRLGREILAKYREAGVSVPSDEELLTAYRDRKQVKMILAELVRQGELVKVDREHHMDAAVWEQALHVLRKKLIEDGTITLAQYRDLLGSSRKYTVMLLTAFDQRHITKMQGEKRILLKEV